MSDKNNDVFQVLVTEGNLAVLAAGNDVGALAPGQIGVFDANSHLSINAATTPKPREFYLAVGINRSGGNTFEDFRQSAGQLVQRNNIANYTFGPHSAGRPMIVDVTDIKGSCEKDYVIRVEQRNSKISAIQGCNQFSEAFSVRGACCTGCENDCDDSDPNDVAMKMVANINANSGSGLSAILITNTGSVRVMSPVTTAGIITLTLGAQNSISVALAINDSPPIAATKIATAINAIVGGIYKATNTNATVYINGPIGTILYSPGSTGIPTSITNVARTVVQDSVLYLSENAGGILGFAIQAAAVPLVNSDGINLHYHKLRETFLIVSLVEGFNCAGTVTVNQELAYEQGSGQNIKQLEYHASAWNGAGPYVASEVLGLAIGNLEYFAKNNTKYNQIDLEYFMKSESGWLQYESGLRTTMAIPATDTTTSNGLLTVLDSLVADLGFDPLLNDAAVASNNPAVVEPQPANANVDGIA